MPPAVPSMSSSPRNAPLLDVVVRFTPAQTYQRDVAVRVITAVVVQLRG